MSVNTISERKSNAINNRRFWSHTPRPRVVQGISVKKDEFSFVIRLMIESKPSLYIGSCTGFLISSQWTITAAHCLRPNLKFIMCGDMSKSFNETKCKANILKQIPHVAFLNMKQSYYNDIALMQVEETRMQNYGRISAADYRTFEGRSARYGGFGLTDYSIKTMKYIDFVEHDKKPLQIGQGVIFFGDDKKMYGLGRPQILIAPKCSNKKQHIYTGDSGGPLMVGCLITGVACYLSPNTVRNIEHHPALFGFTPISPYIDWIRETISSN